MISSYTDDTLQETVKPFIKKYGDIRFFELMFGVIINTLQENETTKVSSNYFNKKIYNSIRKSLKVEILELELEITKSKMALV
jgi:hypothetical protein